jgi:hypothetical protein
MPRGKRKSAGFVFGGGAPVRPLLPGELQCPHTLKPQARTGCSQCIGAKAERCIPIDGPTLPEARPSNPTKHGGC